jgi:hypothetical protein
MEAIRSSETSVLIRATRRHLPEDDNHHSHRRGNLKSYIAKDDGMPGGVLIVTKHAEQILCFDIMLSLCSRYIYFH